MNLCHSKSEPNLVCSLLPISCKKQKIIKFLTKANLYSNSVNFKSKLP